jgi:hypothetical protein
MPADARAALATPSVGFASRGGGASRSSAAAKPRASTVKPPSQSAVRGPAWRRRPWAQAHEESVPEFSARYPSASTVKANSAARPDRRPSAGVASSPNRSASACRIASIS